MQNASAQVSLSTAVDAIRDAVDRLEGVLPPRADSAVLLESLEDDLREGLDALSDVDAHFHDILHALKAERPSPISLLEAGEDFRVLERLDDLAVVVAQLRKRLSQAAGKMKNNA